MQSKHRSGKLRSILSIPSAFGLQQLDLSSGKQRRQFSRRSDASTSMRCTFWKEDTKGGWVVVGGGAGAGGRGRPGSASMFPT